MAHIAQTMFEVSVSNITRNGTQNIPAYFGSVEGSTFTSEICPAGFLTVKHALTDSEGYTGIKNGNTWQMVKATNGLSGGMYGDHTGIYAFNSYGFPSATDALGNVYHVGASTFGLELPVGERGDFTELIVGEQYTFGKGNFSTLPTDLTYKYITIANGLLVASTSAPDAGTGVYLELLRTKPLTIGARDAGFSGYVCVVKRTAEAE